MAKNNTLSTTPLSKKKKPAYLLECVSFFLFSALRLHFLDQISDFNSSFLLRAVARLHVMLLLFL